MKIASHRPMQFISDYFHCRVLSIKGLFRPTTVKICSLVRLNITQVCFLHLFVVCSLHFTLTAFLAQFPISARTLLIICCLAAFWVVVLASGHFRSHITKEKISLPSRVLV